MLFKLIAKEIKLFKSFSWARQDKKKHTYAVIDSMHRFLEKDFEYLYKILYKKDISSKNQYIDMLKNFHKRWVGLPFETQEIIRLAIIYHDFFYTENENDNRYHGFIGAPMVQEDLKAKGYSNEIINKVSEAVKYHGFTSDFGSHFLIHDANNIDNSTMTAIIYIDLFDAMGRYDEMNKRINYTDGIILDHLSRIQDTISYYQSHKKEFFKYRLSTLVCPYGFGLRGNLENIKSLMNSFQSLPENIRTPIIRALNHDLRIYDFPLTKDLYQISQEILGINNYELFFKQLFLLSIISKEHPNIFADNNFMSIRPEHKKIGMVKKWAQLLNKHSFEDLNNWAQLPEISKRLRFDGLNTYILLPLQ